MPSAPARRARPPRGGYDDVEIHRRMVGDEVRTRAFRESIHATVRPGDAVLDVGAGSAILSLFAAQAGARRVYAVERAPGAAALARRVVAANGFSGRVRIIEDAAETAILPEPVNVIVSEWLGVIGVDENMLPPVLVARDRWLKPGGVMIPGAVAAHVAPVHHPAAESGRRFLRPAYGLDLRALAPPVPDEPVWVPEGVSQDDLRAEPQRVWVTDPRRMPAPQARRAFAARRVFVLRGPVNALAAWFSAAMPGAPCLTDGPGAPRTHWGQYLFPIANGAVAGPSDRLEVGFGCLPTPWGGSHFMWASRLNDGATEAHDTRRGPGWPGRRPPARRPAGVA